MRFLNVFSTVFSCEKSPQSVEMAAKSPAVLLTAQAVENLLQQGDVDAALVQAQMVVNIKELPRKLHFAGNERPREFDSIMTRVYNQARAAYKVKSSLNLLRLREAATIALVHSARLPPLALARICKATAR